MTFEIESDSGRVHIRRIGGDTDEINHDAHMRDHGSKEVDDPRYVLEVTDHTTGGPGKTWSVQADTVNVNGAAFAAEYAEFGGGAHKRVYRDPDDPTLVRVIISPRRL